MTLWDSRIPEISSGPSFGRSAEGSFVSQTSVSGEVGLRQAAVILAAVFNRLVSRFNSVCGKTI